jgi:hypothetical protein
MKSNNGIGYNLNAINMKLYGTSSWEMINRHLPGHVDQIYPINR